MASAATLNPEKPAIKIGSWEFNEPSKVKSTKSKLAKEMHPDVERVKIRIGQHNKSRVSPC